METLVPLRLKHRLVDVWERRSGGPGCVQSVGVSPGGASHTCWGTEPLLDPVFAAQSPERDFSPAVYFPVTVHLVFLRLPPTYLPSLCLGPGQPATVTCQAVVCPTHQLPWGTRES